MNESRGRVSRRAFLEAGVAGAALVGCNASGDSGTRRSGELAIDMAGYDTDRVRPLIDGRVRIEGCETAFELDAIGDMNTHALDGPRTREVTEIGLSPYMLAYANESFRAYTLIPVFPVRLFRHKSIFVRTDRGISRPEDLKGRRVATPGYSSTSLTWIRGIMQHEYGVSPQDIEWVVSAEDSSAVVGGKASKQESVLPAGLHVSSGTPGKDESDLLVDGEVDALFHAVEPRAFSERNPLVGRLFDDSRATEQEYFVRTGIFPIMHAIAVRRDVCDEHPWLPAAVFDAYSRAKRLNYTAMQKGWVYSSLPWYAQELDDVRELMGDNFWPYGIEANRKALEALFAYSHEQGLASRELRIEELFHPSTLELVEST